MGRLGTMRFLFLLFLFLVDRNLALQLSLGDGLAKMFEGLVGTFEAVLIVLWRWAFFFEGYLLLF